MGRWPSEAARCRFELDRPPWDVSGLWRSLGCECRMRLTRRASLAWIARRRRDEASILNAAGEGQLGGGGELGSRDNESGHVAGLTYMAGG